MKYEKDVNEVITSMGERQKSNDPLHFPSTKLLGDSRWATILTATTMQMKFAKFIL